jgi:hypothetical protein
VDERGGGEGGGEERKAEEDVVDDFGTAPEGDQVVLLWHKARGIEIDVTC